MRIIIGIILAVLLNGNVFAEYSESREVTSLVNSSEQTAIPVPGTANMFTQSFKTSHIVGGDDIVVMYKAASSGTISLTLSFEESYQKALVATTDATYLQTKAIHTSLADNAWHMATIDTVNGIYGRVRILGGATNDASTTIQIKVIK